jgi:hypothetical protein
MLGYVEVMYHRDFLRYAIWECRALKTALYLVLASEAGRNGLALKV